MAFTIVQYIRQVNVSVVVASTVQYTVPASRQDVVKCITVANPNTISVNFSLSAPVGSPIFVLTPIPPNQTMTWTGTLVLNAGDTITTAASATGLSLTVSGLESQ